MLRHYRGQLAFRAALLIPLFGYLVFTFFRNLQCQAQKLNCALVDSVVIFPFYLLLAPFVSRLNFFSYVLLYIFSSVIYTVIFYHIANWLELIYLRFKERPRFILKRI